MFGNKNWNYSNDKQINFQNAQNFVNSQTSNPFDNRFFINPKASSFCNPSDYYINKQLFNYHNTNQDNNNMNNMFQTSYNNIEKLFSPNIEKVGEKKKSKKDNIPSENQFVIYLEKVFY